MPFFLKIRLIISTTFCILLLQLITNAAGILDPTFGENGIVQINFTEYKTVSDVEVQQDGKIVIGGNYFSFTFIARYNSDGTPDTEFGENGVAVTSISNGYGNVFDISLQQDGKIVAVGRVPGNGYQDFFLVRFNSDGTLDNTFGNNGSVIINQSQYDIFKKVTIQPDGKIVAVGGTNENGSVGVIMRFNQNGTFDTEFAAGGIYFEDLDNNEFRDYGYFDDVEILQDGKILTGGDVRYTENPIIYGGAYTLILAEDGLKSSAPVITERTFTHSDLFSETFDAAILPDGKIAIVDGTGMRIQSSDNSTTLRYYRQTGNGIATASEGKIFVSSSLREGSYRLHSFNNLIGNSIDLPRGKIAVQSNNKFIIANNDFLYRVKLFTSQGTRLTNYNADDKTDIAIQRADDNSVRVLGNNNNNYLIRTHQRNFAKVFPEFTEYRTNDGLFRSNIMIFWESESTNQSQSYFAFDSFNRKPWGLTGDIPFGGDFDGDGFLDVGVFRPSEGIWYGFSDAEVNQNSEIIKWGTVGDKPVPADYDYDGKTDYAIYRPSTGTWWILRSSDGGFSAVKFGIESDIPLTGDYDGDGKADFTVYRPSEGNWYQLLTTEGFRVTKFGISTDYPVPGDYDGDGKHDVAVFRQGVWYILQSTDGLKIVYWGTAGDIPVAVRYDQ